MEFLHIIATDHNHKKYQHLLLLCMTVYLGLALVDRGLISHEYNSYACT